MRPSTALGVMAWALLGAALPMSSPRAEEPAPAAGSLLEAVLGGQPLLGLRPRLELARQDNKPDEAQSFTLRTLAGWRTKPWHGLGLTLEMIDVRQFIGGEHVDTVAAARTSREPLVLDPEVTDFNQLYVDYTGVPDTRLRVGRWELKLDNVRFVGNVEFRQVLQVFDGVQVVDTHLPGTELLYAYLWGLRRIDGNYHNSDTHLLHASHAWSPADKLVAYTYLQDQPFTGSATGFADNSNAIFGLRADGAHPFGETFKALYTLEYARQVDYADGDGRVDAHYLRVGAGPQWGSFYVRVDYERLSSNDGLYGFQMPLATLHPFQGWNDLFVTTPPQGIEDFFLSAGYSIGKAKLLAEYHHIASEFGDIDFGNELNLALSYPLLENLQGKIEYAHFEEDERLAGAARKPDTTRLWFTLNYTY